MPIDIDTHAHLYTYTNAHALIHMRKHTQAIHVLKHIYCWL